MKCNRCGSENAEGATFCSACGTPLQPGVTVAAPIGQTGPIVSGNLGPNGPTTSITVPIKSKKLAIALTAVILAVICGGVVAAILLGGGKTTTYVCSKEGDILTSSVAATFKRDKISKLEYTLILENNNSVNSRSNYSYSGPATITSVSAPDNDEWDYYDYDGVSTGSSSSFNADSEEMMEVLALSFFFASFEQYSDDPGIDYYENERDNLATYAITIDVNKLAQKTKDAIFDDGELEITSKEFQKGYTAQGYTCKQK